MTSINRKTLASLGRLAGSLATVLSLSTLVQAASDSPSAGDAALFDRLDANHDGTIAADEAPVENRSLFDRLLRRGDANHDLALSRTEFLAALVPTCPEKPLEAKESATLPGANAVRYLLLTMDADRNARIEKDEVPRELRPAFAMMAERMDKNANGALERQELSRGGPAMSAVAGRYVARLDIDVDAEVAKLKKSEGQAFDRFEQQPMPLDNLRDPKQARKLFAQFDENADGKLEPQEVPDPLQEQIKRLIRIADRDGDGKLTKDEFLTATERIAKIAKRRQAEDMPLRDAKPDRQAEPGDSNSDKK